jgi:hypothetical protein
MFPEILVIFDVFQQHCMRVVERYLNTGNVTKQKPAGKPSTLNEEVGEDIRTRMQRNPNTSIRRLSLQTGLLLILPIPPMFIPTVTFEFAIFISIQGFENRYVMKNFNVTLPIIFLIFHVVPIYGFTGLSYGSCSTVLKKMLRYHPYKISVVQSLIPPDYLQRVRFCNWFNEIMNNDILDNTFFSDEGWFHLDGYVNKQNYRIWSGENPHAVRTATLHPVKVGVWLAVSRQRVYGPVFFNFTVNSERYIQYMLLPFLNQLTDQERQTAYFQQDSARAHIALRQDLNKVTTANESDVGEFS